jgi:ketosteroid isomerase-like protein
MARDPEVEFLIAEAGIRQLYARYADAVWRKDREALASCFTKDATWKIAGQTLTGHEAIGSFFEASVGASQKVMFWWGQPVLDISGDEGTGRLQVTELIKRDEVELRSLAIYYERYRRVDGRWLLSFHHFNMHYLGPPDLSGELNDCREYGAPPGFPGADDPTTRAG